MIKQHLQIKREKKINLFLRIDMALHLNKLESLHQRMFGLNWPSCFEENILKFLILRTVKKLIRNVFSLFHYYIPLEMGIAPHLNKIESPSPRDALCQV